MPSKKRAESNGVRGGREQPAAHAAGGVSPAGLPPLSPTRASGARAAAIAAAAAAAAATTNGAHGRILAMSSSSSVGASSSAPALHLHPSASVPSSLPSSPPFPASSRMRAASGVLSGEEADSEPSSAGGSLAGSTDSLHFMGHHANRAQASRLKASTLESAPVESATGASNGGRSRSGTAGSENEMDREVRTISAGAAAAAAASAASPRSAGSSVGASAPPSPSRQKGWKISSSSLNLLLSSHLSHHFGAPPPRDEAAGWSDADGPKRLSWWRRWLSPSVPLSPRGLAVYVGGSFFFVWMVRAASHRARINRTMASYLLPFLVREAPHLWMVVVLVGLVRTLPQLRREFNPALLAGWTVNVWSFLTLGKLFSRILRVGATPFQQAMEQAGIPVPKAGREDVLTIVPVQGEADGDEIVPKMPAEFQPAPSTSQPGNVTKPKSPSAGGAGAGGDLTAALTTAALTPSSSTSTALTPASSCHSTALASTSGSTSSDGDGAMSGSTSTASSAYRRIGRMTPLRWLLATTQLTKTLAWVQEIQWRTGVVYEKIYTKQKTHALKLDIYRPKVPPPTTSTTAPGGQRRHLLPCFLYIHGGGWVTGHRSFHSLTLLYAIAKAGFMVVSVNYRLSPWVKHPTHLMDCKRALAWLRTHAEALGGDPSFCVVGGESAGAHLACLMALTPNVLHLQPGLEDIDTTVQGVVDLYGCHDFTDCHYHFRSREDPTSWLGGFASFLHRMVIGHTLEDARAIYEMASPYFRLLWFDESFGETPLTRRTLPPFFGAHGTHDDLIPIEDSEVFYELLAKKRREAEAAWQTMYDEWEQRAIRRKSVESTDGGDDDVLPLPPPPLPLDHVQDVFIRVPHASHAFNNVMGVRSFALNDSVTVWLAAVLKSHRERQEEMERRKAAAGGGGRTVEPTRAGATSPEAFTRAPRIVAAKSKSSGASSRHQSAILRMEAEQAEAVVAAERDAELGTTTTGNCKSTQHVTAPLQLLNKL